MGDRVNAIAMFEKTFKVIPRDRTADPRFLAELGKGTQDKLHALRKP
jgi:hypothetical protein